MRDVKSATEFKQLENGDFQITVSRDIELKTYASVAKNIFTKKKYCGVKNPLSRKSKIYIKSVRSHSHYCAGDELTSDCTTIVFCKADREDKEIARDERDMYRTGMY